MSKSIVVNLGSELVISATDAVGHFLLAIMLVSKFMT
jgi:hypothetical protein